MWKIQSIDTMKYSRDLAKAESGNAEFSVVIEAQVKDIAETGATHVAIGTPYDAEFLPMLEKWVSAVRANNLNVWFRGNWAGWEGWFAYPKISREQHLEKTRDFILNNPNLFEDGDIFTACPECENGGPGDPRMTGDMQGFRNFMVSEYNTAHQAFSKLGKKVSANFYSMNGDVAKLAMNKETTKAMGGIVVFDHYVKTAEEMTQDIESLQQTSGGEIFLGEFGAPILDIHGKMTEEEQAKWLDEVLGAISEMDNVRGVNYWVNKGGLTGIWSEQGESSASVSVLEKYFKAKNIFGIVTDKLNYPIEDAKIFFDEKEYLSHKNGYFEIKYVENVPLRISVSAVGFQDKEVDLGDSKKQIHVVLERE